MAPKFQVILGGMDSECPIPFSDRPISQNNDEQVKEGAAPRNVCAFYTPEEIRGLWEELKFFETVLATVNNKTDPELYEDLKKFDGCCLDGNLAGERFPNSPHPKVRKRGSDGRYVYFDPENPNHHEQLLSVRLIDLATFNRKHYLELLQKIDQGQQPPR